MQLGGLQKLTLLDYPGQMACIIFTAGCNLRCPFCHNASLVVRPADNPPTEEEFFAYLEKRQGLLDGVVVSGGEPLLQPDCLNFLGNIKNLGYLIKLDTNGTFPTALGKVLQAGLVDYVAMDIKNSPAKYSQSCGLSENPALAPAELVNESLKLLRASKVPFELRTTLVKGLHDEQSITEMAHWISGPEPYYLQSYVDSGDVIAPKNLSAFSKEKLEQIAQLIRQYCPKTQLRI